MTPWFKRAVEQNVTLETECERRLWTSDFVWVTHQNRLWSYEKVQSSVLWVFILYVDEILTRFVVALVGNSKNNVGGGTRRGCKIASSFTTKWWSCTSSYLKCKRYVYIALLISSILTLTLHTDLYTAQVVVVFTWGCSRRDHLFEVRSLLNWTLPLILHRLRLWSCGIIKTYWVFRSRSPCELCKTVLFFYRWRSEEGT